MSSRKVTRVIISRLSKSVGRNVKSSLPHKRTTIDKMNTINSPSHESIPSPVKPTLPKQRVPQLTIDQIDYLPNDPIPNNLSDYAYCIKSFLCDQIINQLSDENVWVFWQYGLGRAENISQYNIERNNGYGEIKFPHLWIKKGLQRLYGEWQAESLKKQRLAQRQILQEQQRLLQKQIDLEYHRKVTQEYVQRIEAQRKEREARVSPLKEALERFNQSQANPTPVTQTTPIPATETIAHTTENEVTPSNEITLTPVVNPVTSVANPITPSGDLSTMTTTVVAPSQKDELPSQTTLHEEANNEFKPLLPQDPTERLKALYKQSQQEREHLKSLGIKCSRPSIPTALLESLGISLD